LKGSVGKNLPRNDKRGFVQESSFFRGVRTDFRLKSFLFCWGITRRVPYSRHLKNASPIPRGKVFYPRVRPGGRDRVSLFRAQ